MRRAERAGRSMRSILARGFYFILFYFIFVVGAVEILCEEGTDWNKGNNKKLESGRSRKEKIEIHRV